MTLHRWLVALGMALSCALTPLGNAAVVGPDAQSAIPYKRERTTQDFDMSRVALGLLTCLGVAGAAVYAVRRRFGLASRGSGHGRHLRLVEMQRLGPKAALFVVEFGGTNYLLAHSDQGVHCVASEIARTQSTPMHDDHD